ncbi:MAG: sigma-70 family RNA polymerase sigma factor [Myxococcales bacterium]
MDVPLQTLLAQRSRFLAFVRRQIGDEAAAEDLLQAAFVRAAQSPSDLHSSSRATAWFYRILRNAIVDHYRRRSARENALAQLAREGSIVEEPAANRVCDCVFKVLPALREDHQAIIRAVEIDGRAVAEVAGFIGITANNASVRLHRARTALREGLMEFCVNCCTDETVGACRNCYCHD